MTGGRYAMVRLLERTVWPPTLSDTCSPVPAPATVVQRMADDDAVAGT